MSFRQTAWNLSPARLRTSKAAKLVYAFVGLPLDILAEAADQATKARFPEFCPPDALPYHGRDRGIVRGLLEPAVSYRARLLLWRDSWRAAGVGRSMLDQIAGFLLPNATGIRLWSQVGIIYNRAADGTLDISRFPGLWDWDGLTSLWARFWILIDSIDDVPWSRDGTWGDGELWGDDPESTWGSTASRAEVQAIRGIIDTLKPAGSVCKNVLVVLDVAAMAVPNGTWAHWSKNVAGVQVPARAPQAIYWDGVP